jgi:large subunit ribosomal protein L24
MKQKFSNNWIGSVQVRKQRKYRYNAPLHKKHSFLSAHLSKELRKKYEKRSIPLRKGDEVLIMRGSFKNKKGKIIDVNVKKSKVSVENINRAKKDGTKVNVYLNPSILVIHSLNLDDNKRLRRNRSNEMKEDNIQTKEKIKQQNSEEKNASSKNTSN